MTTTILRHPDDATLMAFAAGTLGEALAAAVAAHVAMCDRCRREVADMELLGEGLLLSAPALAGVGAAIDIPRREPDVPRRPAMAMGESAAADPRLPWPIAQRYGLTYETIPWRFLAPGIWQHRLDVGEGGGDLRLLRISRGLRMPEHGHGGTELTLVLDGAYSDITGSYRRGDVQDIDEDLEHRPVADAVEGCVCLVASEAPARFKGLLGKLIPPLTGL